MNINVFAFEPRCLQENNWQECKKCNGSGYESADQEEICEECEGEEGYEL